MTSSDAADPYAEPGDEGHSPDERSRARDRVQARRDLLTHAVVYLAVNTFLVRGLGLQRSRLLLADLESRGMGDRIGAARMERLRRAARHGH